MIFTMGYNRYFKMNIKKDVAYQIWQAREEVGIEGTEEGDWSLAERFLQDKGDNQFEYDDVYIWVMENI